MKNENDLEYLKGLITDLQGTIAGKNVFINDLRECILEQTGRTYEEIYEL